MPALDAGAVFDNISWSDGTSGKTLDVTGTGTYWVTAWNNNSVCISTDTVQINIPEPYDQERLCVVTVDMETGKNLLVWEKTENAGILSYNLYRESGIGAYNPIANIPFDNLSIYTDTDVSPENRTYLYKITVVDTCGNESDILSAPYHKPIFLTQVPSELGVSLEWTDYEIQGMPDLGDYLTSFEIYRGTESTGLSYYTSVGSINNYLDTDQSTTTTRYFYRVAGVLKSPCFPSGGKKAGMEPVSHSISNLESNEATGNPDYTEEVKLMIYPNPFMDKVTIRFKNPVKDNFNLMLVDISGKIVLERNISDDEITLQRNNLQPGFYQLILAGNKIFRGSLVLE